jgi:hypothetical protein
LRKRDPRLIITQEERYAIFRNAEQLEALHSDLPDDFWHTKAAICRSTNGLVPLENEDFDHDVSFANGFLSQDIGLSQCQTDDGTASDSKNLPQSMEMESSDLYASCRSIFTILCERAKNSNNPEIESIIRNNLATMQSDVAQEMLRNLDGQQDPFAGEIVSSHVPFDRRQKFKRIRGAGEPRRQPSSSRGVRTPVVFDIGSLM